MLDFRRFRKLVRRAVRSVRMVGRPTEERLLARRTRPELVRTPNVYVPLRDPPAVRAETLPIDPDELVLGLSDGLEHRMYPTSGLFAHHVVNDWLGALPVVIGFCPRCFSGVAYEARVDGRRLTFLAHAYHQGSMAMRDDQTGSVWPVVTGEAVEGELTGRRLRSLQARMTPAREWLAAHPGSLAPDPGVMDVDRQVRPGQLPLGAFLRATITHLDDRLPPRTLVIGVEAGSETCAYVVPPERERAFALSDQVGGVPIVLLAPAGSWPVAFERRAGGGVLELRPDGNTLVDQNDRRWAFDGRSLEGARRGTALPAVASQVVEWYAWVAHHPDTSLRGEAPW